MQYNSFVVRTRARESFLSSVSCFRSRRLKMRACEPDGLRQAVIWIGLARIRITENREERKRALPLKCPSFQAWAFIASMNCRELSVGSMHTQRCVEYGS